MFQTKDIKPGLPLAGVLILWIALSGCFQEPPTGPEDHPSYPGMVAIKSRGDTIQLGSVDEAAQIDEQPLSGAGFSYNYFIDTIEVTIGRYREIMGTLPAEFDTLGDINDNFPICYVSWFNAVLFCNARSVREQLDTVYSYISIETTPSGDIYRMSGLKVDYSANGYRLPTEAEWIYAARGNSTREYLWGNSPSPDSADRYSWHNGNSDRAPHVVASRMPNGKRLYDLAGSVSEWVNESKISFSGTTITDFVGGTAVSNTAKIVKGGSYNHDVTFLRIPCRSDVYQVEAASRNRYTGFRCVAGAIENPSFLSRNNQVINLEPVVPTVTSTLPFIGTNNAILAFVNTSGTSVRTLCFIDYRNTSPAVYQFTDQTDVFNPTISPDGRWVAWSNLGDGAIAGGSVFVRPLLAEDSTILILPDEPAFIPRWYIDPATSDTFVLYVSSAQLNDQAAWGTAQTKMIRFSGGAFSGTPRVVEANGAYHGGRSANGTFLATGYPLLKMKNLTTGERKTLFYSPFDGKTGSDTSQVCNVSISPGSSTPDRVLFLDFGSGRDTSTITTTVYHSHEYLFCSGFSGTVYSWYQVPEPYYTWDHTEFSNSEKYAVATAATPDGAHRAVYCINLLTSSSTSMCEGTDLWHPCLWIAPGADTFSTTYDLDSTGQYDNPHLSNSQAQLCFKMRLFWHYAESLDVIIVGSSVAAQGIDPRYFTDLLGFNLAIGGGDLAITLELIQSYVLNQCNKLKILALSFDMSSYFSETGAGEAYYTFVQSKGYLYDKNHLFWSSGVTDEFHRLVNAVTPPPDNDHIDSLGLCGSSCLGYGPVPPPILGDITVSTKQTSYLRNKSRLLEMVRLCALKNIKVLLINFPMHPGYAATESYGALGPSHATAQTMLTEMYAEAQENSAFSVYDAHLNGEHDYTEFEFSNFIHLCDEGAAKLSTRVDSVMHVMLNE